ncbi:hypothetical protein X777_05553 [Ooceraea biroi]|nr:hypothetical protein X777_05553 [Ooceraea biroi]
MPSTVERLNVESTAVTTSDKLDELRTRENVPKERNASPSVVARKGVQEKIKPRKGVEDVNSERTDMSFNQTRFRDTKLVIETNSASETAHIDNQSETSNITTSRLNVSIPQSRNSATVNELDTGIVNNVTKPMESSHMKKHIPKPKPTVTSVDGPEVDDYRPSSRTKSSPLGMPRKIDYIVPVVTTIFALPLLCAAIFILYKRGRECWDKRHYRRMDFLIDGMYNE